MCRGYQESESEKLRIRAFYAHLSLPRAAAVPPDSLTLHFLPRIDGSLLEVDGARIRPDSPAFVTLHRAITGSGPGCRGSEYGSRERVTVCEGARFEIYVADLKVVKGFFRRGADGDDDSWKMECKCVAAPPAVKGVEVAVAAEGLAGVMSEKVEMAGGLRRKGRRCCELEEIPEVREEVAGSGACCCSECGGTEEVDGGGGDREIVAEAEAEAEAEAVGWAVDVGIWAVCFGVGYLVSASSFKRYRRKSFI